MLSPRCHGTLFCPRCGGTQQLGANWARTESYLDRKDLLVTSPVNLQKIHVGDTLVAMTAGLYTEAESAVMQGYADKWSVLSHESMPRDWTGVLAPLGEACVLAVANFGEGEDFTDLSLRWGEWAPVFNKTGTLKGQTMTVPMKLDAFQTYRGSANLFVQSEGGDQIKVSKTGVGEYEFLPVEKNAVAIKVLWKGPLLNRATFEDQDGTFVLNHENVMSEDGIIVTVHGKSKLMFYSDTLEDITAPFVEIMPSRLNSEGVLTVAVTANDRSGLKSVQLFMDDMPFGAKMNAPYEWRVSPRSNSHRFTAVAVDASPAGNSKLSHASVWVKASVDLKRLKDDL